MHRPYVKIPSQTWQRPNPRAQMLLCPVDQPTPALLAQRMNVTARNGLGEHLVAGIKALRGHDL